MPRCHSSDAATSLSGEQLNKRYKKRETIQWPVLAMDPGHDSSYFFVPVLLCRGLRLKHGADLSDVHLPFFHSFQPY